MTDNFESGDVPRFSRPISIVFDVLPDREGSTDLVGAGGLLRPFSGVLEMRAGRGRVPILDLSYLTLEPLLAAALQGDGDDGPVAGASALDRVDEPQVSIDEPGTSGSDDSEEPTVKEVIYRDSVSDGADGDQHRRPGDGGESGATPDSHARSETGSSLGTPIGTTVRRVAAITEVQQSGDGRPPPEDSVERDQSTGQQTAVDELQRLERDDTPLSVESTEAGLSRPRMVTDSGSTASQEATPRRSAPGGDASTTVVDRSGDTGSVEESVGEGDSGSRNSSRVASRTAVVNRTGPEGTGPDGLDAGGGRGPTIVGQPPAGAGDGPRMVVETSGGESAEAAGRRGTASGRGPDDGLDHDPGQHPSNRQKESLDESALVEAARNPDSRLIDRLYRSLKERDAIERRREGRR